MCWLSSARELSAEECRWRCDPSQFNFASTAELPAAIGPIGQERATRALEFAATMDSKGYNVFVLGQPGGGGTHWRLRPCTSMRRKCRCRDWCYVQFPGENRGPESGAATGAGG